MSLCRVTASSPQLMIIRNAISEANEPGYKNSDLMRNFRDILVNRQYSQARTLATGTLLCGLVGLYFISESFLLNSPTLCLHHYLFGFGCPGCGMTRALHSLLHLDFGSAYEFNLAVFVLFPLLVTEILLGLHYTNKLYSIRKVFYFLFCVALSFNYILQINNYINT